VAYTLQIGRDAMDERLAIVVTSMDTLCQTLRAYLNNPSLVSSNVKLYRGSAKQDLRALLADGEERLRERIAYVIHQRQLEALAALWSKGARVDWLPLHIDLPLQRVSLPTYRFAQDRYPGVWSAPSTSGLLDVPQPEAVFARHEVEPPASIEAVNTQENSSVTIVQDPSLLCFDENWQRCPLAQVGAQVKSVSSLLCLIEAGPLLDAMQVYLETVSPMTQLYFAAPHHTEGPISYRVNGLADSMVNADLAALAAESPQIAAVLYLLPVQQPALITQAAAVARFLQTLRAAGITPGQIILVGQYSDGLELSHLESWIGFERSIARAWPGTGIKVLMLEPQAARFLTDEDWIARLWAEVLVTEDRSILYRNTERHALRIQVQRSGSQFESGKTTEALL
jgi:acyl transferase domain-containing protein